MAGDEQALDVPVHLHERTLACENTVFSVYFDHVSGAGGHDVPRYISVVPHHRSPDGISGVSVLPVMGGRFGLIRVFRHPVRRWGWEVPKGFVDAGETMLQAALRELAEETGYSVPAARLTPLGVVAPEAGVIEGRVQGFAAQIEGHDVRRSVANGELGHGAMRFFTGDEIGTLIAEGGIEDAATLALMFLHACRPAGAAP